MIYCSNFFYDGEIYDLYYDIESKQIKFYLDGLEQYIPSLNTKYNYLCGNNINGRQLLLTSILSLGIIISALSINGCVDYGEARAIEVSTVSVESQLDPASFYKELYNNSDSEFKKEILDLTKIAIKDNGNYIDQEDIINKFSQLDFVYTSNDELLTNTSDDIIGRYDPETNTIYLKEGLDEDVLYTTIFHEMLHFFSNSGFTSLAIDKKGYIGDALNEGMTQLLVNEYYNNQLFVYSNEVSFTKALIEIVGNDFMREAYFSHDLDSLINELSKYSSYNDAISLLKNMDNAKVAYNDDDRENYNVFSGRCWDIIETIYFNKYGIDMEKDKLMMSYKEGTSYDSVVSVSKKYYIDNKNDSYMVSYYYVEEDVGYLIDRELINEEDRYIDYNIKKKTTK